MTTTLNPWRRLGLRAYTGSTWPVRTWLRQRLEARQRAPLVVLFYHRVAESHPNAWTIAPDEFERQVRWLRSRFELVSFAESLRRMREGNDRVAVHLTFDDGYAENCDRALPWLIEQGVPCTYFVTTRNVLEGEPFPHDRAAGAPLQPNTPEQLRELADAGIEVGAHTRTHADLGRTLDAAEWHAELDGAKQDLETLLGRPVRYFATPYGQPRQMTAELFRRAQAAGYEAVCSAHGGYNLPARSAPEAPVHVLRIHGDPEFERLANWLTLDPRKLKWSE